MIGILGIGYLAAATNPLYHWPIVLVGWLGNIAVPLWLLSCASHQLLSWQFADSISAAGVIWWVPFGLILWRSYASHTASLRVASPEVHSLALRIRTNRGQTLQEMSQERPLLLVFLRHRGCPFCRETLADFASSVEKSNVTASKSSWCRWIVTRSRTISCINMASAISRGSVTSRGPFTAPSVCAVANSGTSSGRRFGGAASKPSCSKPTVSACYTPTPSRCPAYLPFIKGKSFAASCIAALQTARITSSSWRSA